MDAMDKDQRQIEEILEAERVRVEDGLKAAVASRKARDERDAKNEAEQEHSSRYVSLRLLHCSIV